MSRTGVRRDPMRANSANRESSPTQMARHTIGLRGQSHKILRTLPKLGMIFVKCIFVQKGQKVAVSAVAAVARMNCTPLRSPKRMQLRAIRSEIGIYVSSKNKHNIAFIASILRINASSPLANCTDVRRPCLSDTMSCSFVQLSRVCARTVQMKAGVVGSALPVPPCGHVESVPNISCRDSAAH